MKEKFITVNTYCSKIENYLPSCINIKDIFCMELAYFACENCDIYKIDCEPCECKPVLITLLRNNLKEIYRLDHSLNEVLELIRSI